MIERTRSKELFERALRVEPNGIGGSDLRGVSGGWDPFPIFMANGEGAYLEDVDGHRYIDYLAAWGPLILGHRPPRVVEAVHRAVDEMGSMLGFCHELEVHAAESAIDAVPCWEKVRFTNTGSEAVMLAVRMARAYTGRTKLLRFEGHYHGWSDSIYWGVDDTVARSTDEPLDPVPATAGLVPPLGDALIIRQWNDSKALEEVFTEFGDQLAGVICEPLLCAPVAPPKRGYLEMLRELTKKHGVVLIFDEVKTGFRVALGGAQELYGVTPDISTAAKALGAGFPIAAVGGRSEFFELFARGRLRQGSTYQANPLALAAAVATLEELRRPGFFQRILSLGQQLADGLATSAREAGFVAQVVGVGPVLQPVFADHPIVNYRDFIRSSDNALFHDFWRGMVDGGVMFAPRPAGCWFVSGAHSENDIVKTLDTAKDVLLRLKERTRTAAGTA